MEIGKNYKIVYKDNNYTSVITAKLVAIDDLFLHFSNSRDGEIIINKYHITKLQEVSNE